MKKLFVCFAVFFSTCFAVAHAATRPNIVFIFSDDHAIQAIGAYGSVINETPHIDRLAEEGAVFENSFCANSICGPSRACILTGKHSHKNGFMRNDKDHFDGSQTTFPKLVQKAGYQTALIGKWHLRGHPTGFDHWEILPGQGQYYNPDFIQMDGKRKRFTGYCTDIITDKTLEWLKEKRDPNKPFVLMCQHKAPHRNWSPAERHFKLFDGKEIPEPETLFDDYANRAKHLHQNEMTIKDHFHWGHDMKLKDPVLFPDHFMPKSNHQYRRMTAEQRAAWDAQYEPENQEFIKKMKAKELSAKEIVQWKYQRYIKDYLRCIAAVDDGVGRILEYLDAENLTENTIVIYSSDQGFYLGEHGWYDKRWMFEESLKMPFVIRWPEVIPPGSRSQTMIQNIDYAPTFLELTGAEIPNDMQGRSLVPVFKNKAKTPFGWRDAIYYAYYENGGAHNVPRHDGVRNDRYKLMYFPVRKEPWQLFDLKEDPREMRSVHEDPSYAMILAGMKQRYYHLKKHYDVNSAAVPASRLDQKRWKERYSAMNKMAEKNEYKLAFIGDSITQGWEGNGKAVWEEFYRERNPINLGIGGDRTEHVIWRLEHGNMKNIKPEVAVIMIGTNNTGFSMQDPLEVSEGVERIVDIIREKSPKTKILLLGVFPRGPNPFDEKRLNNVAINENIRRFATKPQVHYLDISEAFLNPDGTLNSGVSNDQLHLVPEGYKIWAEAMEPKLKELGL